MFTLLFQLPRRLGQWASLLLLCFRVPGQILSCDPPALSLHPSLQQVFFSSSSSSPSLSGCQVGVDDTGSNNVSPLKISLLTIGIWRVRPKSFLWMFAFASHVIIVFPLSYSLARVGRIPAVAANACTPHTPQNVPKEQKHVRHLIQCPEVTRTTGRSRLIPFAVTSKDSCHCSSDTSSSTNTRVYPGVLSGISRGVGVEAPSDEIRHLALSTIIRIPSSLKPLSQDHRYSSTCCGP